MPKSRGRTKAERKRAKNRRREAARARGEAAVQLVTPPDVLGAIARGELDPDNLEQALRRGLAKGAMLAGLPDQAAIQRMKDTVARELRNLERKP